MRLRELAWVASALFAMWSAALAGAQHQGDVRTAMAMLGWPQAQAAPAPVQIAQAKKPLVVALNDAPPPPPVNPIMQSADADTAYAVGVRLRSKVSPEVMPYFNVFLYVSKAAEGPWAQHMYIFHKDDAGDLVFEKSFAVSTGRERWEKYYTSTPVGLFQLDPDRFSRRHWSRTWHAPMPWAMFFRYNKSGGRLAGIALHSATTHEADLGHRASGGCVRLPDKMAEELFHRFQDEGYGRVPVFATDADGATNKKGQMVKDVYGRPVMTYGYKVLVFVEDYPGGPAYVAVLS